MTFDEARDIIFAIVKKAWDETGFPMEYSDISGKVPDNETVWARSSIRHATGNQASLSGDGDVRRWNRTGTLFVQVYAPIGDGYNAGYTASQIVVNALQKSRHPELWFRDVRMNEIGESGAFEQFNVLATFDYDDVR
jgi:hypothetical protein